MVRLKIIINNIIFLNVSISLKLLIVGLTRVKGGGLRGVTFTSNYTRGGRQRKIGGSLSQFYNIGK